MLLFSLHRHEDVRQSKQLLLRVRCCQLTLKRVIYVVAYLVKTNVLTTFSDFNFCPDAFGTLRGFILKQQTLQRR